MFAPLIADSEEEGKITQVLHLHTTNVSSHKDPQDQDVAKSKCVIRDLLDGVFRKLVQSKGVNDETSMYIQYRLTNNGKARNGYSKRACLRDGS